MAFPSAAGEETGGEYDGGDAQNGQYRLEAYTFHPLPFLP